MKRTIPAFILALFTTLSASAQLPLVDIGLVDDGNGQLEVRVRPDGNFDEVFSSLVFTIRWGTASGVVLGNISQVLPELGYMQISKSDDEADAGGFRYQVFAGFGFNQISAFSTSWVGGMEVVLMTIPYQNGTSTFEIVNDTYTDTVNGDYFVSLNGSDQTGIIYTPISTSIGTNDIKEFDVQVLPNPSDGIVDLTLSVPSLGQITIELHDQLGRLVFSTALLPTAGQSTERLDLSALSTGAYTFRILQDDQVLTTPFIIR